MFRLSVGYREPDAVRVVCSKVGRRNLKMPIGRDGEDQDLNEYRSNRGGRGNR